MVVQGGGVAAMFLWEVEVAFHQRCPMLRRRQRRFQVSSGMQPEHNAVGKYPSLLQVLRSYPTTTAILIQPRRRTTTSPIIIRYTTLTHPIPCRLQDPVSGQLHPPVPTYLSLQPAQEGKGIYSSIHGLSWRTRNGTIWEQSEKCPGSISMRTPNRINNFPSTIHRRLVVVLSRCAKPPLSTAFVAHCNANRI